MALIVSRYWPYMTPEYIYNEMTWNEFNDAMEYVHLYELTEAHYAAGVYRKNKKLTDWWRRKKPRENALLDFAHRVKAKAGG